MFPSPCPDIVSCHFEPPMRRHLHQTSRHRDLLFWKLILHYRQLASDAKPCITETPNSVHTLTPSRGHARASHRQSSTPPTPRRSASDFNSLCNGLQTFNNSPRPSILASRLKFQGIGPKSSLQTPIPALRLR